MIAIDSERVFVSKETGKDITFQEILDSVEPDARPTTDEELKDLLWCFGIDTAEVFED